MDKIDEQDILEKLEMLEEMEQLDQKAAEAVKKIYDTYELREGLILDALVSLPRIIKRNEEEIQLLLSYGIFNNIILAKISLYKRNGTKKEYGTKVGNLELSPELPEELRKELVPEIRIGSLYYATGPTVHELKLRIPYRGGLQKNMVLIIREIVTFKAKTSHHIIAISLGDVLWLALTLSDRDIERVVREIMKHSREDALLFTIYGVIVKKARQLLLSNPNLIEEAVKRRAEIEMKREKELEELLRKQNIPIARIPSERAITMRKALKDLRQGKDPEKTLKREIERFNFEIARVIHTKEVIDLFYGDEYRERVLFWRRMITVEDVLNIITNITKEDLEKSIAAMKNVVIKAEVLAEYIEELRNYASRVISLYKHRREELEKQIEKILKAITT